MITCLPRRIGMRARAFSIFRASTVVACEGVQANKNSDNETSNDTLGDSKSPFTSGSSSPILDLSSRNNPYTFRRRRLSNVRPRSRRSSGFRRDSKELNSILQEPQELLSVYASELDPFSAQLRSENASFSYPSKVLGMFSCSGLEPILVVDEDENGKEVASISTTRKINQDRGCATVDVSERKALYGVYDGHGEMGDSVSQFVMSAVSREFQKHPCHKTDLVITFTDVFRIVDNLVYKKKSIDTIHSGTTACVALVTDETVTTSNVGDSRCVLARRLKRSNGTEELLSINLTTDHNPDVESEYNRIISSGGFVTIPKEVGYSARVWTNASCTEIGLAMARSIGDRALRDYGVICDPDVQTYEINKDEDEFLILGSDGIWEFISSEEAVVIIDRHLREHGATTACEYLVREAATRWRKVEGDYRDDITAIVVDLRHPIWE